MEKKNSNNKIDAILRSKFFLIGLLLMGLIIFIYPLISDRYYKVVQNNYSTEYEKTIQGMSKEEVEAILAQAHEFNEGLFEVGGSDLFSSEKMVYYEESYKNGKYPEFFYEGKVIGTVEIPKVKTTLPVFTGVDDSVLEKATGYMQPSSLPVGGEHSHCIITGHRGLPQSRLFRDLGELKEGDIFFVKVLGEIFAYETDAITIIEPTDFSKLGITEGEDEMTLLTCHPYTINSHRLLVKGHRVEYTEEVEKTAKNQKDSHAWRLFFEQYKEYFYGILAFIILLIIVSIMENRKKRRGQRKQKDSSETKKE